MALELRAGAGMMELPSRKRSLTISSDVSIQYTNVTDRQTDGRTDRHRAHSSRGKTASVQRPYSTKYSHVASDADAGEHSLPHIELST